jgi:hypothetical protein
MGNRGLRFEKDTVAKVPRNRDRFVLKQASTCLRKRPRPLGIGLGTNI